MSNNVVLTDVNEEQIMPITTSENVFVNPDMTLKEFLETLNAGGSAYILPVATPDTLGGIKVGDGLAMSEDGTLSCTVKGGNGMSLSSIYIGGDIMSYS